MVKFRGMVGFVTTTMIVMSLTGMVWFQLVASVLAMVLFKVRCLMFGLCVVFCTGNYIFLPFILHFIPRNFEMND